MSLEELLTHIQHGDIELWFTQLPRLAEVQWSARTNTDITYNYTLQSRFKAESPFILKHAIETHVEELFRLLLRSDTRVCMSPGTHWPLYIQHDGFQQCETCRTMRIEWSNERV